MPLGVSDLTEKDDTITEMKKTQQNLVEKNWNWKYALLCIYLYTQIHCYSLTLFAEQATK